MIAQLTQPAEVNLLCTKLAGWILPPLSDERACVEALSSLARFYGPEGPLHGEPVELCELTRVLLDGERATVDRIVAGAVLASWSDSKAVRATTRKLLLTLGCDTRERLTALLAAAGWQLDRDLDVSNTGPNSPAVFGVGPQTPANAREQTARDLQVMNDVLSASALAGRFWIIGSTLRAWALGGELPEGKSSSFEFAFRGADIVRARYAFVDLIRMGFLPRHRYPGPGQTLRALNLMRHGTTFILRRMDQSDPTHQSSYSYCQVDGRFVEVRHLHVCQPMELVDFLDRPWFKPLDHESELRDEYGDWRSVNSEWSPLQAKNIAEQRPWSSNGCDLVGVALI